MFKNQEKLAVIIDGEIWDKGKLDRITKSFYNNYVINNNTNIEKIKQNFLDIQRETNIDNIL